MPFFALEVVPGNPTIHVTAPGRAEALAEFGKTLGQTLTDKPTGTMAPYRLDEWSDASSPHMVHPTIPIWKLR